MGGVTVASITFSRGDPVTVQKVCPGSFKVVSPSFTRSSGRDSRRASP
jgi:hypothetical protein